MTNREKKAFKAAADHFDQRLTTVLEVQQAMLDVLESLVSRVDALASAVDEINDTKDMLERALRLKVVS